MLNREAKETPEQEPDIIFGLLLEAYRYTGGRVPEKEVATEEHWHPQTRQV